MIFKRFYDEKLAQASYLVGCQATGEAVVVDPNRDVEPYLEAAAAEGLRLAHVTETHIHADFVSGVRELAARTRARLYLSGEGGPEWRYEFAGSDRATLLRAGDAFMVGRVRLEALHTPGHTPEHLCFLVTDGAQADRPMGVFSGDCVFVGDVGRPDLLEKAAGLSGTMVAGARDLFRSLQRFRMLPDYLQIWPAHGAGSACGKSLGAMPHSTLGYEKLFNWAFSVNEEAAFVEAVLAGQPEPPRYFAEMKRINRAGPPVLGGLPRAQRLAPERIAELLQEGALVVDARPAADYARGFLPGTLNIPLDRAFSTWAGSLLPFEHDFFLLIGGAAEARIAEATRDLALIGFDRVAGWAGEDALRLWTEPGRPLETIGEIEPEEAARRNGGGDVAILDVRGAAEWESGHIAEARHIPLGYLADHMHELPRDRALVVHCQSGHRSAIAASLLRARGFQHVYNLRGGIARWRAAGLPVTASAAAAPL